MRLRFHSTDSDSESQVLRASGVNYHITYMPLLNALRSLELSRTFLQPISSRNLVQLDFDNLTHCTMLALYITAQPACSHQGCCSTCCTSWRMHDLWAGPHDIRLMPGSGAVRRGLVELQISFTSSRRLCEVNGLPSFFRFKIKFLVSQVAYVLCISLSSLDQRYQREILVIFAIVHRIIYMLD